jgi:V8-like Glu-specific endopeptidase
VIDPSFPAAGRWIRRGGGIVLLPGAPDGRELEGEVPVPAGGKRLVYEPELGYGWESPGAAQAEVGEMGWRGAAGPDEMEEEVIGDDGRIRVNPTSDVPFRFICRLRMVYANPAKPGSTRAFGGTGTLISNKHVLTSAHMLRKRLTGGGTQLRTPLSVTARPGKNLANNPFGESASATVRTAPGWDGRNTAHDWGLVTLADELGARKHAVLGNKPLGFWGSPSRGSGTRISLLEDRVLNGTMVNLSGYAGDKCGADPAKGSATADQIRACGPGLHASTQWRSVGHIKNLAPAGSPGNLLYDLDAENGHSGSPVWLRWKEVRFLVAIHKGRLPRTDDDSKKANRGVRLTEGILTQLRTWMRADGVEPSF